MMQQVKGRWWRWGVRGGFVAMAWALAGCATVMTSEVTAYHREATALQGQAFRVVPSPDQRQSLEFERFAQDVRAALRRQGLIEGGPPARALVVQFDYGLEQPVFRGRPGYDGSGIRFGGISLGVGMAMGRGVQWGAGIPLAGVDESPDWRRHLALTITRPDPVTGTADGEQALRVYEGRVLSEGSSDNLAVIVPLMVQALFREFPGRNGQTWTVDLPRGVFEDD